ncbi:MAG TPA: ankyrin repeat domain-containing protein [Pyrinomonadaceae bacterium]|jgi:ankyrin repeat protein|nr:ankyrin repeat domain-containing protein [Pyrinomonadaceae bacterium]
MSAAVTEANTLARQLWHIAGSGDLEQLDELLSQGADVNAADRTGVTAIMRAAYHGQLAMVRALIGYGADPTAKDRSGLTALMMAEYGGHEEIVDALRPFAARGQREVASKPRVVGSVTEQNVDVTPDYDDWEPGENSQAARTLREPLEIWEMVHTTQPESYAPSAGPGRVFSTRILALTVGALIICSGAVFGFLALRGAMSGSDDSSEQRSDAAAQTSSSNQRLSDSKALTKEPGNITRSSNELTKLKPVEKLMGERVAAPTATASVSSAKKSSASQRPTATKVSAAFPKQNKNVRRATKLESEQDAISKSAKKEPAPPARDPVKPSTTQKPKVIQWPN